MYKMCVFLLVLAVGLLPKILNPSALASDMLSGNTLETPKTFEDEKENEVSADDVDLAILKSHKPPTDNEDFEVEKIFVVLKHEYSFKEIVRNEFLNFSNHIDIESIRDIMPIRGIGEVAERLNSLDSLVRRSAKMELDKWNELINVRKYHKILEIKIRSESQNKEQIIKIIAEISKAKEVLFAEPIYNAIAIAEWIPNDPGYNPGITVNTIVHDQWGLRKINMENAWEISRGNTDVTVGIMESGIADHTDFRDVNNNSRVIGGNFTTPAGTNVSHGTHVAGIVGSVHNNIGTAGIAQVNMFLLSNTSANFADSIADAANNGIHIINASFAYYVAVLNASGQPTFYPSGDPIVTPAGSIGTHVTALFNYDGLLVCSAGNDDRNTDVTPQYPSAYNYLDNVLSVGATMSNDMRPSVSNWGSDRNGNAQGSNYGSTTVSLFAPGDSILSTHPEERCDSGEHTGTHVARGYHRSSGTSFAAPHVTGVAALMLSLEPRLSPALLKEIILESATGITIQVPNPSGSGTVNQDVKRLDAEAALTKVSAIQTEADTNTPCGPFFEKADISIPAAVGSTPGHTDVYLAFDSAYQGHVILSLFGISQDVYAKFDEPDYPFASTFCTGGYTMFSPRQDAIYRVRLSNESASGKTAKLTVANRPQGGYHNSPHNISNKGQISFSGWYDTSDSATTTLYFTPAVTKTHILHFKPDAYAFAPAVYISDITSSSAADVYESTFGDKECFVASNLIAGKTYFIVVHAQMSNPNYSGMTFTIAPVTVYIGQGTMYEGYAAAPGDPGYMVGSFSTTGSKGIAVVGLTTGIGGFVKLYIDGVFSHCFPITSDTVAIYFYVSSTATKFTVCAWYP